MNRSISIILPVYNAERYLRECIGSVIKIQDELDWELIVIDDESVDASAEICDAFSAGDSRVRVFHIKNQGVSHARNLGLSYVIKDYITFIDADDWIDKDQFIKAFDAFVNLKGELGFTPFFKVESKTKIQSLEFGDTRLLHSDEKKDLLLSRLAPSDRFMGSVWKNFYSKELLQNISFDIDLKYQEDVLFLIQALFTAENVAIVNIPFYYYRVNEYSANFNKEINSIENRMLALSRMMDWALLNGVDLSFTKMKRMCPIYARMFLKASVEYSNRFSRVKALWDIHKSIERSEIKLWKFSFFGKSFWPYVVFRRNGLDILGFFYLCIRFF